TVNVSSTFPPRNTATVLNAGVVSVIDLGPGKVRGALEVLRLLASHPLSRATATRVATAWRGDRELTVARGQGQAWVVTFANEAKAKLFQRGMAALRAEQHPASATGK